MAVTRAGHQAPACTVCTTTMPQVEAEEVQELGQMEEPVVEQVVLDYLIQLVCLHL